MGEKGNRIADSTINPVSTREKNSILQKRFIGIIELNYESSMKI